MRTSGINNRRDTLGPRGIGLQRQSRIVGYMQTCSRASTLKTPERGLGSRISVISQMRMKLDDSQLAFHTPPFLGYCLFQI